MSDLVAATKTSEAQTFNFQGTPVRIIPIEGEAWFPTKDVVTALGRGSQFGTTANLAAHEKGITKVYTPGGPQDLSIISESGLYRLTMRSNSPLARPFQDWVTRDVLPAIRKDGGYIKGEEKILTGEMTDEELVLRAMVVMKAKVDRLSEEKALAETKVPQLEAVVEVTEPNLRSISCSAGAMLNGGLRRPIMTDAASGGGRPDPHRSSGTVSANMPGWLGVSPLPRWTPKL